MATLYTQSLYACFSFLSKPTHHNKYLKKKKVEPWYRLSSGKEKWAPVVSCFIPHRRWLGVEQSESCHRQRDLKGAPVVGYAWKKKVSSSWSKRLSDFRPVPRLPPKGQHLPLFWTDKELSLTKQLANHSPDSTQSSAWRQWNGTAFW